MNDSYYIHTAPIMADSSALPGLWCAFGIRNLQKGKLVRIQQLSVNASGCGNSYYTLPSLLALVPIGAVSGGEALPVVKADTQSADLPAQVLLMRYPEAVEYTQQFSRQSLLSRDMKIYTTSNALPVATLTDICVAGTGFQSAITLHEGQGIAIVLERQPKSSTAYVEIVFFVVSTGAGYRWAGTLPMNGTQPLLALFNGAGSGVVLRIDSINLLGDAPAPTIPLSLRLVHSIEVPAQAGVSILPADSSAAAFPSGVRVATEFPCTFVDLPEYPDHLFRFVERSTDRYAEILPWQMIHLRAARLYSEFQNIATLHLGPTPVLTAPLILRYGESLGMAYGACSILPNGTVAGGIYAISNALNTVHNGVIQVSAILALEDDYSLTGSEYSSPEVKYVS
jgi:hypothetical protein